MGSINKATMNGPIHVFMCKYTFTSLGGEPRSRVVGSYDDKFRFDFLINVKTFSKVVGPFSIPASVYKRTSSSTSSSTVDMVILLKDLFIY